MTSWPLVIVFVAPLAGWLVGRVHPGILGGIGLTVMSVGCFSLSFVPVDTSHFGLVWRLMLCGMGFGFFQSPNNHMLLRFGPPLIARAVQVACWPQRACSDRQPVLPWWHSCFISSAIRHLTMPCFWPAYLPCVEPLLRYHALNFPVPFKFLITYVFF